MSKDDRTLGRRREREWAERVLVWTVAGVVLVAFILALLFPVLTRGQGK